jgi:anti-sigma regulatory factor (Ser/Thr protein kinase)
VSEDRPTGVIELTLPADARLVRLARLVASGVAAAAGFDVEEVEDLRIAVDELCGALVEGGDGSPIELRFDLGDEQVDVEGTTPAAPDAQLDEQRIALSRQILEVVVDSHEVTPALNGTMHVRLTKRHVDMLIDG